MAFRGEGDIPALFVLFDFIRLQLNQVGLDGDLTVLELLFLLIDALQLNERRFDADLTGFRTIRSVPVTIRHFNDFRIDTNGCGIRLVFYVCFLLVNLIFQSVPDGQLPLDFGQFAQVVEIQQQCLISFRCFLVEFRLLFIQIHVVGAGEEIRQIETGHIQNGLYLVHQVLHRILLCFCFLFQIILPIFQCSNFLF